MKHMWLALLAVAGCWAVPLQAQQVTAQDTGSVVKALQDGGYAARLGSDKVGDPMITSGVAGTSFRFTSTTARITGIAGRCSFTRATI